jgi:predicted sulfurtransferase
MDFVDAQAARPAAAAAAAAAAALAEEEADPYCVLLYYQYAPVSDVSGCMARQQALCEELCLLGRVRVAPEGINGTLGGAPTAVDAYTAEMDAGLPPGARPIHWKRSLLLPGRGPTGRQEQKFKGLSVKATKEVVSLDLSEEGRSMLLEGKLTCYAML